jgi:hypothetical protein
MVEKKQDDIFDSNEGKISWAIYTLTSVLLCLLLGGFAPLFFSYLGRNTFWLALGIGLIIGFILNTLRPKYEKAGRFWKVIYAFLLKQMPPPD